MTNPKKLLLFFFSLLINCTMIINDSSAQWVQQYTGLTTTYLRDIEFINSQTGWVCGDGGTILKTTNSGTNWVIQDAEVPGKPLFGIHPVNENVVYCVGWFETIIKTTNGGADWIVIENAPFGEGSSYFSCFFIDENTGWIGSTGQIVKKTTDGGNTFVNYSNVVIIRDMYFKDNLNGIGVSEVSYISKTSNGGENWFSYTIGGVGNIYRISILEDNMTGFVVAGGTRILYKTTTFGKSWDSVGAVPNTTVISSAFSSDSIGWAGTNRNIGDAQLFKTSNGGKNWIIQNASNTSIYNDIFALNDSVVWTCGGLGKIFHTTNGGDTTVGISQISTIVPEEFQLHQNYPNPFNNETIITFKIRESAIYRLEIFDVLGRSILIPFEKKINIGEYNFKLDGMNLGSGIFYYRLSSFKNNQTKAMMILK